jgi:tRNA A37 threonylcarbamoyladenosine dehydratase
MEECLQRTALLLGEAGVEKLKKARVAVFGIGGVGGYATEALARSGVGHLTLFDKDRISISNLNRQIIALHSTLDKLKVEAMKERIYDINPEIEVETHACFYLPENAEEYDLSQYDYILDAVDTVTAKLELAVRAERAGVPLISSMGAGNKLDPTGFRVTDIYKTSVCPLAKVMRKELKARGIRHLKVVYSEELPVRPKENLTAEGRRALPGSVAFVPSVAGLIMAGEVIKDLTEIR